MPSLSSWFGVRQYSKSRNGSIFDFSLSLHVERILYMLENMNRFCNRKATQSRVREIEQKERHNLYPSIQLWKVGG